MYEQLLKNAPAHDSPAFIDYLKTHNIVVDDLENFIIIKNAKYDSPERPWYTIFWKHSEDMRRSIQFSVGLMNILEQYPDWEWLKKGKERQTVGRWHMHIHKLLTNK